MKTRLPAPSRLLLMAAAIFLAGLSPDLTAATYYVSPGGDNANAGTVDKPWLTIQKAADTMKAGDVAQVAAGAYPEIVAARNDGTAAAPITFRAVSTAATVSGFSVAKAYNVIDGFTITGAGVAVYSGSVTLRAGGNYATVKNSVFPSSPANVYQVLFAHLAPISGATIAGNQFLNGGFHALTLAGQGHTIAGNKFTSPNGWDAIRLLSSNTLVTGNTFQDWSNATANANHTDLFQAFANNGEMAQNNVIEKNIAFHCVGTQIGSVQDQKGANVGNWIWRNNIFENVESAISMSAPGMQFYNNLFYRTGVNTSGPILFRASDGRGSATGSKVFNNIFVECSSRPQDPRYGWYTADAALTDFQADNNLVIGTGAGTAKTGFLANGREAHGLNGKDPGFRDAPQGDFQMLPASLCVGAGRDLSSLFQDDYLGASRAARWDIGPYQLTRPAPPQRLRTVKTP